MPVPIVCAMCDGKVEHLRHLFFECKFVIECWRIMGINVNNWDIEYSHAWLMHNLANGSKKEILKIGTIL